MRHDDGRNLLIFFLLFLGFVFVHRCTSVIIYGALTGELCRSKGVFFHSDAAQAVGKIPIDVNEQKLDLMSISGHKIYGPKGNMKWIDICSIVSREKNFKIYDFSMLLIQFSVRCWCPVCKTETASENSAYTERRWSRTWNSKRHCSYTFGSRSRGSLWNRQLWNEGI